MWPILISVGPVAIHSFGVMLGLGIFLGGFFWWQKGREEGFDETLLMDVWLVSGLVALVTARIWQVVSNWSDFDGSWYRMLFLSKNPGLSYEGAIFGAGLTMLVVALKKRLSVWRLMEVAVMAILTVEFFGWLGSFLAGSNLGAITNWWWGVSFPGVEGKRHPIQLLFGLLVLGLYGLLKKWEKEYRGFKWYGQAKGESRPGFLVAAYLIGLGLIRFSLGFLMEKSVGLGILPSQWFGLGLVVLGGLLLAERSGINIGLSSNLKRPKEPKSIRHNRQKRIRKKRGFDFK